MREMILEKLKVKVDYKNSQFERLESNVNIKNLYVGRRREFLLQTIILLPQIAGVKINRY